MPGEESPRTKGPLICPECGEDLTGRDIKAHIRQHYGEVAPEPRLYPDAAKRHKALLKMAGGGA